MQKDLFAERGHNNGEVVFSPAYLPLPEKPKSNFQLGGYMAERSHAKKKNLAAFFTGVHDQLRTVPESWGQEVSINSEDYGDNGDMPMRHNADRFTGYERGGVVQSEIKASASRGGKYTMPLVQLKKYAASLIERSESEKLPSVHYSFFFYGQRGADYDAYKCERSGKKDKRAGIGRHICVNDCLNMNLARDFKQAAVIPLNLMIALFSSDEFHKRYIHDQSSSWISNGAQGYLHFSNTTISRLNGYKRDPVASVGELLGDHVDDELRNLLELDSLKIVRGQTPDNLVSRVNGSSAPVASVPITMFDMPKAAERRWLDKLWENGEWLMEERLGLGPLYDSSFEVEDFTEFGDDSF